MLVDAGLSAPEARTYLALYEVQESQSGRLADAAAVPTSKIYAVLQQLAEKGLVSHRLQNNIKIFQAAPPDALVAIITAKEQELAAQKIRIAEAISRIKQRTPIEPPISHYKYYEGINGIKSLWNEIQERMHDDTLLIHTAKQESYASLAGFYAEFHKHRVKKKIHARILFPGDDAGVAAQRKQLPLTEVRYDNLRTFSEFSVINDMVAIQHLGKKPHAFLIRDQIFADTFKELFEKVWRHGHKQ